MEHNKEHYLREELYRLVQSDRTIFDFLQAGSLDGLWYWDIERPQEEWLSPRLKEVFGYTDDEISNTSAWWQENIFPEDLPPVLENFRRHCADPAHPYDQIVRYRHKNGGTVWIRCRGIAIRDTQGRAIRMLGAHTDVTAIMEAQESKRQQAVEKETVIRLQLEQILDGVSDAFIALDRDWRCTFANAPAGRIFNRRPSDLVGKDFWAEFPERVGLPFHQACLRAMAEQVPVELEIYSQFVDGWFEDRIYPTPEGLSIFIRDITARKRSQAMVDGQKKILEMVALGEPLDRTLDALVRFLESQSPDMLCSILLVPEEDATRVRHGAAPSLPAEYCRAIDGAPIGPCAGSCGTAIFRREPVFVADIASDPLWAGYKHLALPHGLKACWSTPIFDSDRNVLGSFAVYYRQVGLPNDWHRELIALATHTASICISRQRSVALLRATKARLRLILDGVGPQMYVGLLDPSGTVLIANQPALDAAGLRAEDVIGRKLADSLWFNHSDTVRARAIDAIRRAAEGEPSRYDEIVQVAGGRLIWVDFSLQTSRDADGKVIYLVPSANVITERKEAESALRQSEARYALAVRGTNDGLWDWNVQTGADYLSPRWKELLGFADEELPNQATSFFERLHPDDVAAAKAAVQAHLDHRAPYDIELRLRTKDGSYRLFRSKGQAEWDEQGRPLRMAGAISDITAQKQAVLALRDSAEFNRQVIAGANEGVVVLDGALRYTVWNPFMEDLLGLPASEVLGRHPEEIFPWIREGGQLAALERALRGETIVLPDTQRLKTGHKRISWLHSRLAPLHNATGQIVGVIVTISDVTERKRAEEELRESHTRLRALATRLREVREEQSAHIAREIHDVLGQQLTALKLDLAWLKRRVGACEDAALRGVLSEKIVASSQLVDLTIQSVQRVATELRPGLLEKLGLPAALAHEAREFAGRTGLTPQVDLGGDTVELDLPRAIEVFRVCQEILTNIARHAHATAFAITLRSDARGLTLEVSDNGRGIAGKDLEGARSLGVLGMRERAGLLGGTLDISGAAGQGTRVRLTIPRNAP